MKKASVFPSWKRRFPYQKRRVRGFTILEMLISSSILISMVCCLTQLIDSATDAARVQSNHFDADAEARMVLDRIAFDISKMVRRPDVDYLFQKNTGNDQMAFYSETGGYSPSGSSSSDISTTSLVSYRINSSNQLERLSKSLVWNGVNQSGNNPMVFLPNTLLGTWPAITASGSGTDPNYQVIGNQVFRFEFCFLDENSTHNAQLSDSAFLPPETNANGMSDTVAIVVSLAILDSRTQTSVTPAQLQAAAGMLPDATGGTIAASGLPAAVWQSELNSASLGLNKAAQAQVRIYQRYCFLSPAP